MFIYISSIYFDLFKVFLYINIIILGLTSAQEEYGVESFSDVRQSSCFVDKTLLIRDIFSYNNILVTAPRFFGKSVNIDMLNRFLRKDLDTSECQRIFRGTKIMADEQFVREHMNKHPVLFCNFDIKFEVICFESMICFYRQVIYGIFIEHDYLSQSPALSDEQRGQFTQYIEENSELEEAQLADALRFLSELLHLHHDKRVIVLIDEYDAIFVDNLLIKDGYNETEEIMRFQANILKKLLSDNKHVERAFLSGTLPLQFGNIDFKQIKFTQDEEFVKYYGFTDDEVHTLVDEFSLSKDERMEVQKWYDGYHSIKNGTCIFSPLSISKFLKIKRAYGYWVYFFRLKDIIMSLMEIHQFQETIVSLVKSPQPVVIKTKQMLTAKDLHVLKQGFNKAWVDNLDVNIVFQFLLEVGYLTFSKSVIPLPESSVLVKVPNKEILDELSVIIKIYFSNTRES